MAGSEDRRSPFELLAARIEQDGLDVEHLEDLGLFGADEEDENAAPFWDAVLPAMAVDCLDQLQQLKLVDGNYRVTPDGLRCMFQKVPAGDSGKSRSV